MSGSGRPPPKRRRISSSDSTAARSSSRRRQQEEDSGLDWGQLRRLRAIVDQHLGLLSTDPRAGGGGWEHPPDEAEVLAELRTSCSGSRAATAQAFEHLIGRFRHPTRLEVRLRVLPLICRFFRASRAFRKLALDQISDFVEFGVQCRALRVRGASAAAEPEYEQHRDAKDDPVTRRKQLRKLRKRSLALLTDWGRELPEEIPLRNAVRLAQRMAQEQALAEQLAGAPPPEEDEDDEDVKGSGVIGSSRTPSSLSLLSSSSSASKPTKPVASSAWAGEGNSAAAAASVPDVALDHLLGPRAATLSHSSSATTSSASLLTSPSVGARGKQPGRRRLVSRVLVVLRETFQQSESGLPELRAVLQEAQGLLQLAVPDLHAEGGFTGAGDEAQASSDPARSTATTIGVVVADDPAARLSSTLAATSSSSSSSLPASSSSSPSLLFSSLSQQQQQHQQQQQQPLSSSLSSASNITIALKSVSASSSISTPLLGKRRAPSNDRAEDDVDDDQDTFGAGLFDQLDQDTIGGDFDLFDDEDFDAGLFDEHTDAVDNHSGDELCLSESHGGGAAGFIAFDTNQLQISSSTNHLHNRRLPQEISRATDLSEFARRAGLGSKHFQLEIEFDPAEAGAELVPELRGGLLDTLKSLRRRVLPRLGLWCQRLGRCLPVMQQELQRRERMLETVQKRQQQQQQLETNGDVMDAGSLQLGFFRRLLERGQALELLLAELAAQAERVATQVEELGIQFK